ncbi:hypothetical protein [Oricola indica]|uniref:hypothetical protein n=1 Tax=Oricola indica TaxID=2872591 RepID=UPI003CCBFB9F
MANHANTIPFDRKAIMTRAWELMRTQYRLGNPFTFNDIGRKCFAWCLSEAWREAKAAARITAIPADEKARRVARLREEMVNTQYLPFGMSASRQRGHIEAQIRELEAA